MWNLFIHYLRKALWEKWKVVIIGPIAAIVLSWGYITGGAIVMPQIPILGRVLIGVSTLIVALILAYHSLWLKEQINAQSNWIAKYEMEHRKLPKLPSYLVELFGNHSGPVSEWMIPVTPSGQKWSSLRPSQQKEWRQVVEWLGEDPEDMLHHMRQMFPKDPKGVR
jgi:hypothetical protein